MRTKTLAWAYIMILSIGTLLSLYIPKNEAIASEAIVIPNEAIRLRILANSDSEQDQAIKRLVRDAVNEEISEWVADLTSIEEARSLIRSRLPDIQKIAEQVVAREKSSQPVKAEFDRVKFPTKLYGQFLYPAGEYEAILISLGEGKGANWWCVLFPPLCFLDFSNGVAVSEEEEKVKEEDGEKTGQPVKETVENVKDGQAAPIYTAKDEEPVEVKFFVKELWDKLFE
ncbi:stage II sporulation protein R [Bacillus sp. V3-13]|uniref:stage II sporulation protein R n=1 Tax=Bacillus sp. V3-13 TaxID=2053728 RepID=UPI000C78CABA|nr:stage II sporulation protein R [Bacillus sp. V3-13]PLR76811.1 stage II sporulation protein R [Bacillus sp. V3-13]